MNKESIEDIRARHKVFVEQSYIQLAALSWKSYQSSGRGIVHISFNTKTGSMEVRYVAQNALGPITEKMATEYDPEKQFVIAIQEPRGEQHDYRLADEKMTPPKAFELWSTDEESEDDGEDEDTEDRFPKEFPTVVLPFTVTGDGDYGTDAAELILDAFSEIKYTGICEYYAADVPSDTPIYVVAIALADSNGTESSIESTEALGRLMNKKVGDQYSKLSLVGIKFDTLVKAHEKMLFRGSAEFVEGILKRIVKNEESLFIAECHERLRGDG